MIHPLIHRYVDVGSSEAPMRLHVAEQGSGPPVVLLHGFPEFWFSWRAQMKALADAGYRAIAPDMRGYNESDKPRGIANYRASLVADDIAGLIRSLGLHTDNKAIPVVGHDWGGPIAYRLAMDHPELVSRLFILNGPHPAHFRKLLMTSAAQRRRSWYIFAFQLPFVPERALLRPGTLARLFRRTATHPEHWTDDVVQAYEHAMARPGAASAAVAYYRAARHRDRRPRGKVQCPTLIVWGMNDAALGPECLEGLDRYLPDFRIHRIEGASHWVQQDAAEEVNELLIRELAGHA